MDASPHAASKWLFLLLALADLCPFTAVFALASVDVVGIGKCSEDTMDIVDSEKRFFDDLWQRTKPREIHGRLEIPSVSSLQGKKVLVCSCGSGVEPVLAARAGAEVFVFDISETAIQKAKEVATFNGLKITAEVMDFHDLRYEDDFFYVIYHHP